MTGSSHDSSTFTQIGTQNIKQLPAAAFQPWAEVAVLRGLGNLPVRPGLFAGRVRELALLDAALGGPGGVGWGGWRCKQCTAWADRHRLEPPAIGAFRAA